MSLKDDLKIDSKANAFNPRGKFIVRSYRIARYLFLRKNDNLLLKLFAYVYIGWYRFIFIWILCIELPENAEIGSGLQVWHGFGLVINPAVKIGKNVLLRHNTTIGNKFAASACPVIGDNVEIGAHTVIIGDVKVGDNVVIGAGSVITKSIPANSIVYGSPLVIKSRN